MKFKIVLFLILFPSLSFAQLCKKWSSPTSIGKLDKTYFDEISGLTISKKYNQFYGVNDSGSRPNFQIAKPNGEYLKTVEINNTKFLDAEALSMGPCSSDTCLFIGDIGDNFEIRTSVKIVIIKEESFGDNVTPVKTLEIKYPQGAQNAEGMAVHPNGDVYIITKNYSESQKKSYPARLYKIPYGDWMENSAPIPYLVGEIDVPKMMNDPDFYNQVVTAFDISPNGKKFLFLGYKNVLEFNLDLSKISTKNRLPSKFDYKLIQVKKLGQQEALSFTQDGRSFYYTTEYRKRIPQDIMKVTCED